MSELNLILLGPPGAGKGTQAARLRDDFGLPYIGTGDLLREHRANGTELGNKAKEYMAAGKLVPDELVIEMILEKIEDEGDDGFLLDGFPRSVPQADALAEALERKDRRLTAALLVEAPDDVVDRAHLRPPHVLQRPRLPRQVRPAEARRGLRPGRQAAPAARRRPRGRPWRRAWSVYHDTTEPLIDYYDERGLLRRFDGTRSVTEVHDHIRATLATLRLEERL